MTTASPPALAAGPKPRGSDLLTIPEVRDLITETTGLAVSLRTVNRWAEGDNPRLPTTRTVGTTRLIRRSDAIKAANTYRAARTVS